jgi:isopentenyl-diphosphate delta-isomerase
MLVLVDRHDRRIGTAGKLETHREGRLHRAFSIFLVEPDGALLLQRRALTKYHSGGLWANTCCGHPRPGERTIRAANRRLGEELGLSARLVEAFSTEYRAALDHGLTEHELVHVFVGHRVGDPALNPDEVSETRTMPLDAMVRDVAARPEAYAYWLRHYLARHANELGRAIAALPSA